MIISATTPDETRNVIVQYIKEQASYYRRQGMRGTLKNLSRNRLELASNLDMIAATLSVAPIGAPGTAYLAAKNGETAP